MSLTPTMSWTANTNCYHQTGDRYRKHAANTETHYKNRKHNQTHKHAANKTTMEEFQEDTKKCWPWLAHTCSCHGLWLMKLLKSTIGYYPVQHWQTTCGQHNTGSGSSFSLHFQLGLYICLASFHRDISYFLCTTIFNRCLSKSTWNGRRSAICFFIFLFPVQTVRYGVTF